MTGFAVPFSIMLPVFTRVTNVAVGRHGLVAIAGKLKQPRIHDIMPANGHFSQDVTVRLASVSETPELVKYVPSSQLIEYADESKAGIHSAHAENGGIAAILKENAGMGQIFAAEVYVRKGNAVTLIIQWIICHKRYHGSLERGYRESQPCIFIHLGQVSNSKHDLVGTINILTPHESENHIKMATCLPRLGWFVGCRAGFISEVRSRQT